MTFDIRQLDTLTYDEAEPLFDNYIEGAIEQFANAPEGQAYLEAHPEGIGWIGEFIHLGFVYEGFTLPKMTKGNAQLLLETILPRKITIFDPSDAESAIPELIAFWQFLKREYGFRSASAILKYLETLQPKFSSMMTDPSRGGIAKAFMLMGNQSGFDMTTEEGVQAFQQHYNANLKSNMPDPLTASLQNMIQVAIPPEAKPAKATAKKSTTKQSSAKKPQGMWVKDTKPAEKKNPKQTKKKK